MTTSDHFTARDGLQISYLVDDFTDPWSRPETLLLLHAAMGNAQRWFRWVPRLVRRYRVVRMELRGHGASQKPAPQQDFSLSHLVGDALQLLDLLGVSSAHIVGNSAGGYVGQQLAIHHGSRVKTLALYGVGVGPGDVRYLTLRAAGLVRSVAMSKALKLPDEELTTSSLPLGLRGPVSEAAVAPLRSSVEQEAPEIVKPATRVSRPKRFHDMFAQRKRAR